MPPKALPLKIYPSPPPPPKVSATGEDSGATSPEFKTPTGSTSNLGTSTPKTVSLEKYNDLVAKFNQLQGALMKVCERKEHYKSNQCHCQVPSSTIEALSRRLIK